MQLNQASAEFLTGYFSTHERMHKTKAAYCSDLAQFCQFAGEDISLLSLSGAVIEHWAAHLRQKGYSPSSIRRKMVALRVFCSYWVRKGTLPESPFWRVQLSFGRVQQLPRALTRREMRALLTQARREYAHFEIGQEATEPARQAPIIGSSAGYRVLRNLALVDLLFATGMRVGELSALNIQDFFVQEGVFRVQGKGGRNRLAFLVDKETVQIQREHLKNRTRIATENMALFLNASGGRLSTQGIANVIAQLRLDAGIQRHVTPHMLRHTVATLLLRNGVDIRVVQEFLGHTSIATTQRYTHITKEHMIGVLRKRHPSLGLRA
ncbi:MAG TPA: tyrosine-type recombinase/integrase [Blastocatellia bacterium]|nr:tyrosine-type recombinase/integrase [Blastocatellia bacterium]